MKRKRIIRIGLSLTYILWSLFGSAAQGQNKFDGTRLEVNRKTLPYTKLLSAVDRVELVKIDRTNEGGEILSIAATQSATGKQAQMIASIWRKQNFDLTYSAVCHEPPFAIKFSSRGKVILYASICWACSNIVILEPVRGGQGFNSRSRQGKTLLNVFTSAFSKTHERTSMLSMPNKRLELTRR